MKTLEENILRILIKSKHITKEQLDSALLLQKQKQIPLDKILIEEKMIPEKELRYFISEKLYMPTVHLTEYKLDPRVVKLIPEDLAKKYNLIALSLDENVLTVAASNPLNIFSLEDYKKSSVYQIELVYSPEDEISKSIETFYSPDFKGSQQELAHLEMLEQESVDLENIVKECEKASIVKLVNLIIVEALKRRASDIHVEPEEEILRIRYRIDGSLIDMFKLPKLKQNAVCARIKIVSDMDITENRLPQDGRFKVQYEGGDIDFRVSGLPTSFGQKFVLRILNKANLSIGLDKLGFSQQPLAVFKEAVSRPFGMILVTGPTGSGKSTTLYSILNQLNTPDRNIVTIEDPVEYQVEGITQLQVKPDIGLDFASGLRSMLRQSPDVIMIGEIRDSETADIAIKASLTGQLVLSTLHTNDAISSITRIIDMGVEPFLVASSVIMLCAQRLARKICLKCRKPVDVPLDFLESIGFKEKASFYKADGCSYCNNTGFYGRIAILETIMVDNKMREMIIERKSIDEIKAYAITKRGMKTLRDDAFLKVKEELTTLEEALRITTED